MLRASLSGLDKNRLRWWLILFFLALAIPTGILIRQAYSQLKWEAFHQHQVLAEELAARIDGRFIQLINAEEARSFTDYAFLVIAGDPAANFLQRSPLSTYPAASGIPGLIGYFQVDAGGAFSTPLLPPPGSSPTDFGVSGEELDQRMALANRIQKILSENRLVQNTVTGISPGKRAAASTRPAPEARHDTFAEPAAPEPGLDMEMAEHFASDDKVEPRALPAEKMVLGQAAFDQLNEPASRREQEKKQKAARALGRVEDLKLDPSYQATPGDELQRHLTTEQATLLDKRVARRERSAMPEHAPYAGAESYGEIREADAPAAPSVQSHIRTFESEIDPFEFSLLDSGHFVLFRKVWRDGQRHIQGVLIEQQPFLQGMIQSLFGETALSRMSSLIVAWQGNVFSAFTGRAGRDYLSSAEELTGALLYQSRLSAPVSNLELVFSINRLPPGPGGRLITWVAALLIVVLCGGFLLMYRLGVGQINLARQQQDFVSAVSHELKTPLTSIRMYGEMLREGWAPDDKKATYYDYIHDESERLSRLITNVLQLARMTRNDLQVDLKPVTVTELMDGIRSKLASQIERAGFELNLDCGNEAGRVALEVDTDLFTQIVINLADNAIKFSARAEHKMIDIACRLQHDDSVMFSVRDYGPGVPRDQMKKIFRLFYRSESELTRETVGTGIGLALVHQLAQAMHGQVDVINSEPGAEFRVSFPVCTSGNGMSQ